ncbi:MAG: ATP-binding protein [Candidatus Methylomirabilia bacterium]
MAGNEAVAGRRLEDLLNDERPLVRADVQRAIETRGVTISAPYELRQRGPGLVMRQAVFAHGQLRGMITMILDLPPIIAAAGLQPTPRGLELALRDGEDGLIFGEMRVFESTPITQRVALPEGAWELAAIPEGGWERRMQRVTAMSRALGLIIAGLISALVFSISSRHRSLECSLEESTFDLKKELAERKLAEAALAANETKYRELSQQFAGLLDAIPDSLMLLDTDLKVLWANRAATETTGLASEALTGRYCYALWYERSTPCEPCPVARSFTTGQPQIEIVTRPDSRLWDIRTVPLVDAQGRTTRVIEVKRDITEHRKLEDQLRQAQKLEGIGQLAGGIAHDFNNVLGAMIGFAGVLQMKIGEGDPLRHFVDEIVAAGERGADITRQILMFSRKQAFDLKPERLNGIVRGLEKMLRRLLPESIDLAQDLSGEDPVILADASQLVQVLMNLVTNARDAIVGNGRIGIATGRQTMDRSFVEVQGYGEPGEYAVLTVTDTGHGMDAATRARIFEPFFTTKEPGRGTGLGLAVVHGIVKQHQGYLNVSSEIGKGTVIRVYLPLAAAAVAPAARPAPTLVAGGSETILIAEDETILRKLTRTVLVQYGYTVIEAEDGVDAVAKFAADKEAIRLVILDGLMPKMGGVEALAEIRRLRPDVKALFMSGYDDNVFSGGVLRDKATAFIQKPVMISDLLRAVREVLDG